MTSCCPPAGLELRFGHIIRSPLEEAPMKAVAANTTTPHEWSSDDGGFHRLTGYFGDPAKLLDGPQGFLVEHYPGPDVGDETAIVSHPHYHRVRQFQLVVHGDRPT